VVKRRPSQDVSYMTYWDETVLLMHVITVYVVTLYNKVYLLTLVNYDI